VSAFIDEASDQIGIEAATPWSRAEIWYSVGLIPAAIVAAAVIGWLAVRVNLYFLIALAIPMALIALSCLGLRGIRSLATS
jgi:hypothetical protein